MKIKSFMRKNGKRLFACLFAFVLGCLAFCPVLLRTENKTASAFGTGNYFADTSLYDPFGHGELYVMDSEHTATDDMQAFFFTPLSYNLSLEHVSGGATEYVQNSSYNTQYTLTVDDDEWSGIEGDPHKPRIYHATSGSELAGSARYFYGYVIRNQFVDIVSLYESLKTLRLTVYYPFVSGDTISVFLRLRVLLPTGGHYNVFDSEDVNVDLPVTASLSSTGVLMQTLLGADWYKTYPVSSVPRVSGRIAFVESFELALHFIDGGGARSNTDLKTTLYYRLDGEITASEYQNAVNTAFKEGVQSVGIMDSLYGVVKSFFMIELFPGFYLVYLLLIALGAALFGLTLRLFIK